MKKAIVILLVLSLFVGLCACGGNSAEEAEVKHYLTNYYWYRFAGGNYDIEELYEFYSDGTYESYILYSIPTLNSSFTGTYKINTNKKTIIFEGENGSEYEWTYSLYEDSMKLYNSNFKALTMLNK